MPGHRKSCRYRRRIRRYARDKHAPTAPGRSRHRLFCSYFLAYDGIASSEGSGFNCFGRHLCQLRARIPNRYSILSYDAGLAIAKPGKIFRPKIFRYSLDTGNIRKKVSRATRLFSLLYFLARTGYISLAISLPGHFLRIISRFPFAMQ